MQQRLTIHMTMRSLILAALVGSGAAVAAGDGLQSSEQNNYLAHVRQQHPAANDRQALLAHCNQLLKTHALRSGYQVGQPQPRDQLFQLSLDQAGELVVRNEVRAEGQLEVRHQRLSVFGLDPFIRYECPVGGISCEIKNPADGSPWLTLVRNHEGAAELAKAVSFLMRNLQKG
jgi:hypothetical protein